MFHLKLIKALSYSGEIKATAKNPDAYTEDEAIAKRAVASGYFKLVGEAKEENTEPGTQPEAVHLDKGQLETMKMDDLKRLAADMGIDQKPYKSKAALVEAIAAVEVEPGPETDEDGNEADFEEGDSSPTMIELQKE